MKEDNDTSKKNNKAYVQCFNCKKFGTISFSAYRKDMVAPTRKSNETNCVYAVEEDQEDTSDLGTVCNNHMNGKQGIIL